MEKAAAKNNKLKNKILKLLPKVISFQNIPFSPRRDSRPDVRPRTHHNKAFSGPMIPAEARRKLKSFETFTQEPTSPKVSCTGRVKHRGKISEKKKPVSLPKEFKPVSISQPVKDKPEGSGKKMKKKKKAEIKKFLRGGRKIGEPADQAGPEGGSAPSLSHMRRFASSRETFANFDWTAAQIAPEDCSDEERGCSEGEYDEDDDDECRIPFSAPILTAGGGGGGGGADLEPKKEINLWKRRTMAQPRSLQLNMDE